MENKVWRLCAALFGEAVVAIVLATCLGIIAVLIAVPEHPLLTRRQLIVLCAVVGTYGLIGAAVKVRSIYKKNRAYEKLLPLIATGTHIANKYRGAMTDELKSEFNTWIEDVNMALTKYADKSDVTIFNLPRLGVGADLDQYGMFVRIQELNGIVARLR